MSSSTTEARRSDRRLLVGDTVLVFRETGSKLKDKWNDRFDGPFVVVEKLGSNIYLVQRMGSDDRPQREHVDNLVAAPILPEAVTVQATANTLPADKLVAEATSEVISDTHKAPLVAEATSEVISDTHKAPLKKYEVEEIAGHEDGKYLVKWKGYDAATWKPMENIDCARLIKNYFKLTTAEKDKLRKNTVIEASTLLASLAQLHNMLPKAACDVERDAKQYNEISKIRYTYTVSLVYGQDAWPSSLAIYVLCLWDYSPAPPTDKDDIWLSRLWE